MPVRDSHRGCAAVGNVLLPCPAYGKGVGVRVVKPRLDAGNAR
jgi:hypothetical protein